MYCTNILNLSKVQAYNPRLQQWSVEEPLTNPKHKACAVAIDNSLVITGGTMLGKKKRKKSILITHYYMEFFFPGLGKVKPVWLAEIGSRTVEKFDGSMWSQLPSMNRAKVEHACTVATVNDQRGILVVGGATGDDMVEFLNWEDQKEWKQLGKINRGRGTNS